MKTTKRLILITFLLGQIICFSQTTNKKTPYSQTLEKLQGLWVHSQDTLAIVDIKKYTWTYGYKSVTNISYFDNYTISFKDTVFYKEKKTSQIIILTRPKENEEYEILGLTDSTFSTLDLIRGRINLYYKAEKQKKKQ